MPEFVGNSDLRDASGGWVTRVSPPLEVGNATDVAGSARCREGIVDLSQSEDRERRD